MDPRGRPCVREMRVDQQGSLENTVRYSNAVLMSGQRRSRCPAIKTTLVSTSSTEAESAPRILGKRLPRSMSCSVVQRQTAVAAHFYK